MGPKRSTILALQPVKNPGNQFGSSISSGHGFCRFAALHTTVTVPFAVASENLMLDNTIHWYSQYLYHSACTGQWDLQTQESQVQGWVNTIDFQATALDTTIQHCAMYVIVSTHPW